MKKIFNKILIFALAACFLFAAACSDPDGQNSGNGGTEEIILDTTHGGLQTETDSYILENGNTSYSIVVAAEASAREEKAAGVVQQLFYEATGKNLPIIVDAGITFSEDGTFISVGDNALAQSQNVTYDSASESGFMIKTVGKTVFLLGGNYGIVYSAYELMTKLFDFDYFGEYDYYIDRNVTSLKFYDFDILEIPDIEYRENYVAGTARYGYDPMFADAMRVTETITFGFGGSHNSFDFVPYYADDATAQQNLGEYYTENYRDWFSEEWYDYENKPAQLCYTRHSDEYMQLAVENAKSEILKNPDKNILTFTHQDNTYWCHCDSCKVLEEKYGCVSAGYIIFLNEFADKVNAWAKTELGRDIKVMGMAYHANEAAPTKYNSETGKYEPIDDEVVFSDNLYIQYAPHNTDYQVAFDAPGNEADIRALQSWSALSDKLFLWTYSQANYADYFMFYDNFNSMQRNYQLMTKYRTMCILEQGQWDNENPTAFNNLRAYLAYKLAWNSQADFAGLIDKYFEHVYGSAAEPMRELFDTLRIWYTYLHDEGIIDKRFYQYCSEEIYPQGFLESLLGKIEEAYRAIEPLQSSDAESYEQIKDKICLESMFLRHIEIEVYSSSYTDSQILAMKKQFKSDCERLRISRMSDGVSIDNLYTEWGV